MRIDSSFSRKMSVLSVAAMLSVIFIHSTAYLTMVSPARWNVFVETIVTRSFSRWAVPFFFAVSGFWLGRGGYIQGNEGYVSLVLKKWRTLILPYLCWCVIGFLISLPLILGNNVLGHKGLWDRTIFAIPGVWPKINAFFGITLVGPEGNGPLWYLRSLIVLILFAPVWRLVLRVPFGRWLLAGVAFFNIYVISFGVPVFNVPSFGMSWFLMGLLAAHFDVEKGRVSDGLWYCSAVVFIASSICVVLLIANYIKLPIPNLQWRLDNGIIPLFGIIFFWGAYDRIRVLQTCTLPWSVRQTFFIYCLHGTVGGYFLAAAKYAVGKTDIVTCVCAFVVPWLVFAVCAFLAKVIRGVCPNAYAFVCGGR